MAAKYPHLRLVERQPFPAERPRRGDQKELGVPNKADQRQGGIPKGAIVTLEIEEELSEGRHFKGVGIRGAPEFAAPREMTMEPSEKTEEAIRQKAFEIWERQGRQGDPLEHWFQAKWELDALSGQTSNQSQAPDQSGGSDEG